MRRNERGLLDVLTRRSLDPTRLDTLAALVDGLRHALCTPGEPLTPESARAVIDHFVADARPVSGTFGSATETATGRPCGG